MTVLERWTATEVDQLAAYRRKGETYKTIGERMGRTEGAVKTKAYELKLPPVAPVWTNAQLAKAVELRLAGVSIKRIAAEVGISEWRSVENKLAGLKIKLPEQFRPKAKVREPRPPKPPREKNIKVPKLRVVKPPPKPRFVEGRTVDGDRIGCKFIAGEPRLENMCGAPRVIRPNGVSSYCPHHHYRCHQPAEQRKAA